MKTADFIRENEGYRQFPYKCTAGKLTIAIGRNIEEKGISKDEAEYMLMNDIRESQSDLLRLFPGLMQFPESRRTALTDMRFQLGHGGFRKFKKMIKAIQEYNWHEAAIQAQDSAWFKQVPNRAKKVIAMMQTFDEWEDSHV